MDLNHDKKGEFSGKPDPSSGKYDVGGVRFAKAGVGIHTLILVEDQDKTGNVSYSVLMGRRGTGESGDLANPDKLSLTGGYVEIAHSHGFKDTVIKEGGEETANQLPDLADKKVTIISAFMDYTDIHNKATASIGNMVILRGKEAEQVKDMVASQKGLNTEVKEFLLLPLEGIESQIEKLGGAAYEHELRSILIARENLAEAEMMKTALESYFKEPALKKLWSPRLEEKRFVSTTDSNVTRTPGEFLDLVKKGKVL